MHSNKWNIPIRVLIAGIGGASLGTEIFKCLKEAGNYQIFGCDISDLAYGHYENGFTATYLADREHYVESVLEICIQNRIEAIIPGGEAPLNILGPHADKFQSRGIIFASNSPDVIELCTDKGRFFRHLKDLDIPIPKTVTIKNLNDFNDIPATPCIIKPSTGTGGSRLVFLVETREEAQLYLHYVLQNCNTALMQEYIPTDEGEFTIGVLSFPDGKVRGSIAMQRKFNAKLSVLSDTRSGLISTGYSQGLIDEFQDLCGQAEEIALRLESTGPLNVQGRVRNGVLLPFEVNPRFSASTYLRARAGFNEIDIYLKYAVRGIEPGSWTVKPGYYLRSLTETFVPQERIRV